MKRIHQASSEDELSSSAEEEEEEEVDEIPIPRLMRPDPSTLPCLFGHYSSLLPELQHEIRMHHLSLATRFMLSMTCKTEEKLFVHPEGGLRRLLPLLLDPEAQDVLKWLLQGKRYRPRAALRMRQEPGQKAYAHTRLLPTLLHDALSHGLLHWVQWFRSPACPGLQRHSCADCAKLALLTYNKAFGPYVIPGLRQLCDQVYPNMTGYWKGHADPELVDACFDPPMKDYWDYKGMAASIHDTGYKMAYNIALCFICATLEQRDEVANLATRLQLVEMDNVGYVGNLGHSTTRLLLCALTAASSFHVKSDVVILVHPYHGTDIGVLMATSFHYKQGKEEEEILMTPSSALITAAMSCNQVVQPGPVLLDSRLTFPWLKTAKLNQTILFGLVATEASFRSAIEICTCFLDAMSDADDYRYFISVHHELQNHFSLSMDARHEHILLLGDSIIDNTTYVPDGAPNVITQLSEAIKTRRGWRTTQRARDGAIMAHVSQEQLYQLPADTTVILLSVGGNDGLRALAKLRKAPWQTMTTFFSQFRLEYEALLDQIKKDYPRVALVVCTIYLPQFASWWLYTVGYVGVRTINSIIRSVAEARRVPVIDLWTIFSQREDYANVIEPGVPGGHKLVRNLVHLMDKGDHLLPTKYVLYDDPTYDPGQEKELLRMAHFDEDRFKA